MSYDPQAGGGTPQGTPGGQPTMPVGGGTPPPPSGGYTPPPPPSGGQPTMPTGGYTPPPPPSTPTGGGYTPPPPTPPAGGGGYGAPPPRPTTSGGGGGFDIQSLFQSYINAVTKPNPATFEEEIPRASMQKTLIGVGAVAVVSFITSFIGSAATSAALGPLRDQLSRNGTNVDVLTTTTGGFGAAIMSLIFTFVFFFLGTWIQHMIAKNQGGAAAGGADLGTQAYLSSLSYTPLRIAGAIIGIIPFIGIISFVLSLYQIYLVGVSLQASQRIPSGKAQLAAWVPAIIVIVLGVLCCALAFAGALAFLGAASTR